MTKIERNKPCPCGSGKKFKKCCIDKKPREQTTMVFSSEPLCGFDFDKDNMDLKGKTSDGRLIEPEEMFSQTHYIGVSGKEVVLSSVQDKVIPNEAALMKHLSTDFDGIIAVDTNTKTIEKETVCATGVVYCIIDKTPVSHQYDVTYRQYGVFLFRNCASELHPEKIGWMQIVKKVSSDFPKESFALITDHDRENHTLYNRGGKSLFKDFYLPNNFTMMYGREDSSRENILNHLIKESHKKSIELLNEIEKSGCCELNGKKLSIKQIPAM